MADRSKRTETAGKREKLVKQERKNREQPRREKGKARETGKTGEACPVYKKCGACQYLHLSYEKQLAKKREMLETLLAGSCPVKEMIRMEQPYHYRNKVHAVFGHDRRGNAVSGVYKEGTHDLIPIETCLIEDENTTS